MYWLLNTGYRYWRLIGILEALFLTPCCKDQKWFEEWRIFFEIINKQLKSKKVRHYWNTFWLYQHGAANWNEFDLGHHVIAISNLCISIRIFTSTVESWKSYHIRSIKVCQFLLNYWKSLMTSTFISLFLIFLNICMYLDKDTTFTQISIEENFILKTFILNFNTVMVWNCLNIRFLKVWRVLSRRIPSPKESRMSYGL